MNLEMIQKASSAAGLVFGAGAVAFWTVMDPTIEMSETQAVAISGAIAVLAFTLKQIVLYFVPPNKETEK